MDLLFLLNMLVGMGLDTLRTKRHGALFVKTHIRQFSIGVEITGNTYPARLFLGLHSLDYNLSLNIIALD